MTLKHSDLHKFIFFIHCELPVDILAPSGYFKTIPRLYFVQFWMPREVLKTCSLKRKPETTPDALGLSTAEALTLPRGCLVPAHVIPCSASLFPPHAPPCSPIPLFLPVSLTPLQTRKETQHQAVPMPHSLALPLLWTTQEEKILQKRPQVLCRTDASHSPGLSRLGPKAPGPICAGGCMTGTRCLENGADHRSRNGHSSRHRSFWQEVAKSPGVHPQRISYGVHVMKLDATSRQTVRKLFLQTNVEGLQHMLSCE